MMRDYRLIGEGHYNYGNSSGEKIAIAILNDGTKIEYDICFKKDADREYLKKYINFDVFVFLGEGKIYSVDGLLQSDNDIFCFYKRVK